jgi:uroporphyrinogen-III synthase
MPADVHTVINTRPEAGDFDTALECLGLRSIHLPMICIADPESWEILNRALDRPGQWDGVVLTSSIAVRCFLRRVQERNIDVTDLPPVHVIGMKTAAAAVRGGLRTASVSVSAYATELAAGLPDVAGSRFLQPCSDIAREEIIHGILDRGGTIVQAPVYRILPPAPDVIYRLRALHDAGDYDCVAFFSPSAARHFVSALPEFMQRPRLVAAIGETTADALRAVDLQVDMIADTQSAESMAECIARRLHAAK